ncbi:hypothetical protein WG66_013992 [Moniliophthora roreri]|nr:hypothetical protein WG66_013992 [Moniliophthora roreri]
MSRGIQPFLNVHIQVQVPRAPRTPYQIYSASMTTSTHGGDLCVKAPESKLLRPKLCRGIFHLDNVDCPPSSGACKSFGVSSSGRVYFTTVSRREFPLRINPLSLPLMLLDAFRRAFPPLTSLDQCFSGLTS